MNNGDREYIDTKFEDHEKAEAIRWEAHAERSGEIKEQLRRIESKQNELPCAVHDERFDNLKASINRIWSVVIMVIVLGIILGIWAKLPSKLIGIS